MKTLAAVILTALLTGAATAIAGTHLYSLRIGDVAVVGGGVRCAEYMTVHGNLGIACSKAGASGSVSITDHAIVVTHRVQAATLETSGQERAQIAKGNVDVITGWGLMQDASSGDLAATQTIAALQSELADAKKQLATAQASAVGALETAGVASLMKTSLPQLGVWFSKQGADFNQTSDPGTGFASYTFQCDSCTTP